MSALHYVKQMKANACYKYKHEDDGCFWNDGTYLQSFIVLQLKEKNG